MLTDWQPVVNLFSKSDLAASLEMEAPGSLSTAGRLMGETQAAGLVMAMTSAAIS
jgi:hypothetical protein